MLRAYIALAVLSIARSSIQDPTVRRGAVLDRHAGAAASATPRRGPRVRSVSQRPPTATANATVTAKATTAATNLTKLEAARTILVHAAIAQAAFDTVVLRKPLALKLSARLAPAVVAAAALHTQRDRGACKRVYDALESLGVENALPDLPPVRSLVPLGVAFAVRSALVARGAAQTPKPQLPALLSAATGGGSGNLSWALIAGADLDREGGALSAAEPGAFATARRSVTLGFVLAPAGLAAPLALAHGGFRRGVWYPLLTRTLGRAGPALIKWGQWAATRPDIFPTALAESLRALHASAPTHSFAHTLAEVERETGAKLGESFAALSVKPLASGSIAQVHEATLLNGHANAAAGERVIVKVRHPRVMQRLWTDFKLMRGVARAFDVVPALRFLRLDETLGQFSVALAAQARLDIEAAHLDMFNYNFRSAAWSDVSIPKTIFASPAVIVETYQPGHVVGDCITRMEAAARGAAASGRGRHLTEAQGRYVVERGEDLYLKMLLIDGLMHADFHPGNIIIELPEDSEDDGRGSGNGAKKGDKKKPAARGAIHLVDLGMVATLRAEEADNYIGFLCAMGAGDGAAAGRCMLGFSSPQEQPCKDPEAFVSAMAALFRDKCRGYGTNVGFADVLVGVLGCVRDGGVRIGANYMTLIVNAMCLEAMAAVLYPEYNVLDAAAPMLRTWAAANRAPVKARAGLVKVLLPLSQHVKRVQDRVANRARRRGGEE